MKFNFLLKIIITLIFILGLSFLSNLPKVEAANSGDVVINELMWMGSSASYYDEWLELRNMTDQDIDLSGWQIVGASNSGETLTIPSGKIIPANGYFLISNYAESSLNSKLNVAPDWVTSTVSLANSNRQYILKDNFIEIDLADDGSGNPLAGEYDSSENIYSSMERNPIPGDGTLTYSWHTARESINWKPDAIEKGTPKAGNSLPNQSPVAEAGINQNITLGQTVSFDASSSYDPDGQIVSYYWDFGDGSDSDDACPSHIYNKVGKFTVTLEVTDNIGATASDQAIVTVNWPSYPNNILINELLPNPKDDETTDEYIEIFNRGLSPIDLSGWKLTDASGSHYIISKKDFANTVIPANGYFVLYRDITGIALNNSGGESVSLYSPDGNQKDSVSYSGSAQEDCSYNRTDNGWQWSATLTPGAGNIITAAEPDSSKKVSSIKKAKTTKASSTKASGSGAGSVLGIKKAQAAGNPSSHHFSDNVMPDSLSSSGRWSILVWLIMITSFLSLVIFRFILWRKERY